MIDAYYYRRENELVILSIRGSVFSVVMHNGLDSKAFESHCASDLAAMQEYDKCCIDLVTRGFRAAP